MPVSVSTIHRRRHLQPRTVRGFTLIELLIVIAILLALFGIVAGTLMSVGDKADVDLQRVQLDMIERDGLKMFKIDMKRYPTEDEGLAALWDKSTLENEEDEANWRPYLETKVEKDKWGHELIYRAPSELNPGAPYDLISVGPDGEEGTDDDITNHDRNRNADGEIDSNSNYSFEE
ncbi:MAG: type II secretion system major pseudopilin GspG [Phycisphaerales bacterium]